MSSPALAAWIRALERTAGKQPRTLACVLDGDQGDGPVFLGTDEVLTYQTLAARVNRYARWALATGLDGKVVALLMHNSPDYAAIWLGLTRVNCTVALLNTNVRSDALTHCIRVAGTSHVIVGPGFSSAIDFSTGQYTVCEWPLTGIAEHSARPLAEIPLPEAHHTALLIYTSGTTGLPKAVKITHRRIVEWSLWFSGMMDARPQDRLYNCLPMYHSVGGIVAIGSMLMAGGSVVIRAHFSAGRFWDDVSESRCTIFQYIGELCRYLTLSPARPNESRHHLRLAVGNGLSGDVWKNFQGRFAIPQILEFYAATEGCVSLYNCEGKPGAVGRVPAFLAHRFGAAIIRCDPETGEPVRDKDGLCIACAVDEPGEAIGKMGNGREFTGYTDADDSRKKLLHGVFTPNDRWFRTGDLMRRDAAGFYYFVDRLGDTFRWKGENVSTTEVATVLRGCPGVVDAVVFGVEVKGNEGRAGMAAITTDERFTLARLYEHVTNLLPSYARPMYLRLCDGLETTGTFKLTKAKLAQEGPANASDPVWCYDPKGRFIAYSA